MQLLDRSLEVSGDLKYLSIAGNQKHNFECISNIPISKQSGYYCKPSKNRLLNTDETLKVEPADLDLAGIQCFWEFVAVIAFVADHGYGIQHRRIDMLCPDMTEELAFTQPIVIRRGQVPCPLEIHAAPDLNPCNRE
jgi:hypothetical protein